MIKKQRIIIYLLIAVIGYLGANGLDKILDVFNPKTEEIKQPVLTEYRVVRVIDGDTIEVLDFNNETIRIRLAEIDCPEKKQDFGTKATNFTKEAVYHKNVKIDIIDTDKYGRKIGKVYYDNGKYLSAELVKNGLAIVYRNYSKDKNLLQLEEQAKSKKIGIWSNPNFIEPQAFRQKKSVLQ